MRSVLGAALAGFVVATATGCAGWSNGKSQSAPAPKTLSRARFVYLADRACAREHRREKGIPKPTSPTTLVKSLQRAIKSLEGEIVALRALRPPDADAALFGRVLSALDAQDLDATNLISAYEENQVGRAKAFARRLDKLDKRLRTLDRRLGLRACGRDA